MNVCNIKRCGAKLYDRTVEVMGFALAIREINLTRIRGIGTGSVLQPDRTVLERLPSATVKIDSVDTISRVTELPRRRGRTVTQPKGGQGGGTAPVEEAVLETAVPQLDPIDGRAGIKGEATPINQQLGCVVCANKAIGLVGAVEVDITEDEV